MRSVRVSVWYHVDGRIALYVGRRGPCEEHSQPCPCGWARVLSGYVRPGTMQGADDEVFTSDDPHGPDSIRSLGRFPANGADIGVLVELHHTFLLMMGQLESVARDRKSTQRARAQGGAVAWREAARRLREAVRLTECPNCPLCGKPMAGEEGDVCRAAQDSEDAT